MAAVKPCGGCGRRPVRSSDTGELRAGRYADGTVCRLRCLELMAQAVLILEARAPRLELADAMRHVREQVVRVLQEGAPSHA